MWPLGTSAAEEVAEKAALISIDVPADYKWVLLALVGTNQRSTRASLASIAGTRASLASLTTRRAGVFFANQYLVVGVMQARKKYGIKYPALFAPVSAFESELRRGRHHIAAPPRPTPSRAGTRRRATRMRKRSTARSAPIKTRSRARLYS